MGSAWIRNGTLHSTLQSIFPHTKKLINYNGKRTNFTVDKPSRQTRHHHNQNIKVHIISNGTN